MDDSQAAGGTRTPDVGAEPSARADVIPAQGVVPPTPAAAQDRGPSRPADRVEPAEGAGPSQPADRAEPAEFAGPAEHSTDGTGLLGAVALYTVLRLGLLAVLTVGLMFVMPLIVALAFAVVLQLPLALLLFSGPRHRLTAAMARARSRRSAERDRLRAALLGDQPGPAD